MCYSPRRLPVRIKETGLKRYFLCPCGECLECYQDVSRQWALRCQLEEEYFLKKYNRPSCCVNLTYADTDGELCVADYQLFLKRLRERLRGKGIDFTYFISGEYGEIGKRPHFHCLIFGYRPDDLYFWKKGKRGSIQYRSPFIEQIWTKGFSTVSSVGYKTAFYSAKYMQKFAFADLDGKKVAPFVRMSKRNIIGLRYVQEYCKIDDEGKFYFHGVQRSLPRTFYRILSPEKLTIVKEKQWHNNYLRMIDEGWLSDADTKKRNYKKEKQKDYEIYRKKKSLQV